MYFTQIAQNLTAVNDVGLTSRVKEVFAGLRVVFLLILHADAFQEFFNDALHGVEVSVPVEAQRKLHSLFRQRGYRHAFRQVYIAQLIELDVLVSSIIIGCQRGEDAVEGNGSHDGEILSQRVGDCYRLAQHIILFQQQLVKYLGAFKGITHSLGKTAVLGDIPCLFLNAQLEGKLSCGGFPAGKCGGDLVIAVESRHFLRHIGKAFDILAESRDNQFLFVCIIVKFQLFEVIQHFRFRNLCPQQRVDALRFKGDAYSFLQRRAYIHDAAYNIAAAQLLNQLAGPVDRFH